MTSGSACERPRATSPIPESTNASGTVTAGPRGASRVNANAPVAVPSEAMALTMPIVAGFDRPRLSSLYDSCTMST